MTLQYRMPLSAVLALLMIGVGRLLADSPPAPPVAKARAKPFPSITVEAVYPGANARVVEDVIAPPIEQQVAGVQKMRYLTSRCTDDGAYTLTVAFNHGVDLNTAQMLVQNRVSLALPVLPDLVKRGGVTVKAKPPGLLMLVIVTSPGGKYDTLYLSNYVNTQLKDELARVPGVSDVLPFGLQANRVRLWLDPDKLHARSLTVAEVVKALQKQDVAAEAGRSGEPGAIKAPAREFSFTMSVGRLADLKQFEDLILETDERGRQIRINDVGRAELGAAHAESYAGFDHKPAVTLGIYPTWQARPRELSAALHKLLARLRAAYPVGIQDVVLDFSPNLEGPDPATPEYLLLDLALPAGASIQRARQVIGQCETALLRVRGVQHVLALSDNPFDLARNRTCVLLSLAPEAKEQAGREKPIQTIRAELARVKDLTLRVRDLSALSPFPRCGYPIDLAIHGPEREPMRKFAKKAAERLIQSQKLTDAWLNLDSTPVSQLNIDADRAKMMNLGVSMADVSATLQTYFGSVNSWNFDRTWQVKIVADPRTRNQAEELGRLEVRSSNGTMVPLAAIIQVREMAGPLAIDRLNGQPMAEFTANPATGFSLAQTRALCDRVAEEIRKELKLSAEYRLTWLRETPAAQ